MIPGKKQNDVLDQHIGEFLSPETNRSPHDRIRALISLVPVPGRTLKIMAWDDACHIKTTFHMIISSMKTIAAAAGSKGDGGSTHEEFRIIRIVFPEIPQPMVRLKPDPAI